MPGVQELVARYGRLQSDRTVCDAHWQETAERVLPRSAEFMMRNQAGTKQTHKTDYSTAQLAQERFPSAIKASPTNSKITACLYYTPGLRAVSKYAKFGLNLALLIVREHLLPPKIKKLVEMFREYRHIYISD